ncbi:hypothetical protein [Corynebacterium auriscanis]|uniref:Uncharacterized protein n=1 Tax=Corynebacterium auriscanis TaxID=99807 RepID=A0A0A2DFQ2_9CORY|nr:hypothetical protein [Corynebacterium auriscanis]KGM17975.1 hypothetical protein MA47_11135 [Corynebacterium auriscanis]MCX2164221.1 hypothetical protein [Corynebacterium auriscanis]WJY71754.1 hypothetical protein CAURIC_00350 [Corynebacterium auriscanis]
MSYDIVVIDPATVPTGTHDEFMQWFDNTSQWDQSSNHDSTNGSCPAIAECYTQLASTFPDINSDIDEDDEEADDPVTEYTIGTDFLYIAFDWADAEEAIEAVTTITSQRGLAFVDISDTTTIHFPDGRKLAP